MLKGKYMASVLCEVICDGGFHRYNKGEVVSLPESKAKEYASWHKGGKPFPLVRILSSGESKKHFEGPPAHGMITSGLTKGV